MAINKVIFGGETLVDLTSDTVAEDTMLSGTTAHGANGEQITGSLETCKIYVSSEDPTSFDTATVGDIWVVV